MHRNEKRNDGQQTQLTHETDEKINLSARVIDVLQQLAEAMPWSSSLNVWRSRRNWSRP
jgi:DNA-binding winged helix-turn-helix (wHTH) protein